MNEGKIKILEMLQEGKITVEESIKLMEQVPDETPKMDPRQINPNKRKSNDDFDWEDADWGGESSEGGDDWGGLPSFANRIKTGIEDMIGTDFASIGNDIKQAFDDLDDMEPGVHIVGLGQIFGGNKHKSSVSFVSDPIPQAINNLKLLGKNSTVDIKAYDGDCLRITCKYTPKRPDAQVFFSSENDNYEVLYDYNAMRSMAIYAEVPRKAFIENLHGESKNSSVDLAGIRCKNAHLLTKNSSIRIENVTADEIVARTRNSSIKCENLTSNNIEFETSNSKIDVQDSTAQTARLTTSNAKVTTEYCDIKQLFIKTSNAGIKMEHLFKNGAAQDSWDGERIVEAYTSNGGVSIYLPRDVAAMVQASTSNGRIDSELPNMLMNETSKNYMSGKSADYDQAAKRAKINVSTSNSSIKFRRA